MTEVSNFKPRRKPSVFRRLRRRAFRAIPLLVWLGAIAGAFQLAQIPQAPVPYHGVVTVVRADVDAAAAGHLKELLVREKEVVESGQILGWLDDEVIKIRLTQANAELERLRSEMTHEQSKRDDKTGERRSEKEADMRRFARDREAVQIDVLAAVAKLEEDRVRRQGYEIEFRRIEKLETKGLAAESELTRLKTELDSLTVRIDQNEGVLKLRESRLTAAETRFTEFAVALGQETGVAFAAISGPFQWAIEVQKAELDTITLARKRLILRAPIAGRVEGIRKRPGQAIRAGTILLSIIATESDLVAFVPEQDRRVIKPGMDVEIERVRAPGVFVRTRVKSVAPAIEALAPRFLLDQRVPEFAQSVFLDTVSGMTMVPGEAFRLRFVDTPPTGG